VTGLKLGEGVTLGDEMGRKTGRIPKFSSTVVVCQRIDVLQKTYYGWRD